jgi:hypothetical protein
MTRIVYAAPDYTPPAGVVALPIEMHPAIIEDKTMGYRPDATRREKQRPRAQTAQQMAEHIRTHGPATVLELANAINLSHAATDSALRAFPRQFEIMGRREPAGQGRPGVTWGLRET